MHTIPSTKTQNPWLDLIILLAVTLGLSLALQVPVVLVGLVVSGDIQALLNGGDILPGSAWFTYLLLAASQVGTFLLPAYVFLRMNRASRIFPAEHLRDWKPYVFALAFLLLSGPLMALVSDWNMQMKLPESLHDIEAWMRVQEDNMARVTERLVMTDSVGNLLLNLLLIAALPAIGEEFFFRGALHDIFKRLFRNDHVAVWVGALVFSAGHVQFYGFFPRLLLGAFFGYLLVRTKNIWVSVLAHFANNAAVVLLAFVYTLRGKSYAELTAGESYPIIVYLGSFIASAGAAYWFCRYSAEKQTDGKRLG